MPKISVIVAVYNAEKYLEKCLDSILNQTLKDIEIICVNDGSTDRSWDILKKYSEKDSRMRIFTQENKGTGAAKDFGLYQAAGEYIAFCDSDDELPLDSLSIRYEKAITEKADIVVGNYEEVYDNGKRVIRDIRREEDTPIWWIFNSVALWNKLFSRSFIVNNGLHIPDMKQSEDRVFMTDVFLCNPRIVVVNDVVYYWIRHETDKQCTLSHRFLEQDYFDRIGSWYYSIDKLIDNNYKEANKLLIRWANYLKNLFLNFQYERKKEAFEAIQQLMCRVDWSNDQSTFKKIWNICYEEFATMTYEAYLKKVIISKVDDIHIQNKEKYDKPKVSVIIPCFNSSQYLRECLNSVINQTLKEIEIICVDDGSTDDTQEILNYYATLDSRIIVLHQENKYAGAARNLGMSVARGEYLIFLDSDDFFDINMLKLTYEKAKKDCADVLVFNAYHYDTQTKQLIDAPWLLNTSYLPKYRPFSRKDIPKHIFSFVSTPPWNKLFKRDYISKINLQFQTIKRMNDIYFVMVAIALAERITVLDQKLLFYRVNIPSSLQGTISESPTDVLYALISVQKTLVDYGIYEEVEQSFVNLCIRNLVYALDSVKTGKAFEELYNLIKTQYLDELKINNRSKDYFYREYYYWRYYEIKNKTVIEYLFDKLMLERSKQNKNTSIKPEQKANPKPSENEVIHPKSYKIGCAITWVPRKIMGGLKCIQDHGWAYTWRHGLEQLGIKINNKRIYDKQIINKQIVPYGLNREGRRPRIIASLTSYPARINKVKETIITILSQSMKPDMLILWLSKEEFKRKEKDLPIELLQLQNSGLTIRWCRNLKSHKKYFYVMQEYPNDVIITFDDDLYYHPDTIKLLYESYMKHPNAVSALRTHLIKFDKEGKIELYKNWKREQSELIGIPSMRLFATGVGGILYPPHCMHKELFNKKVMLDTCEYADDVWLKVMQIMNGTPTVQAAANIELSYVEGTQKEALYKYNLNNGGNDIQIRKVLEKYNEYFGKDDTLVDRIYKDIWKN